MVEWEYTVQSPEGPHARPTSKLAMKAMKFSSDIRVSLYQNSADAKSILEVMTLGVGRNDKILVRVSGEDKEEVLEAVRQALTQENDSDPQRFQIKV